MRHSILKSAVSVTLLALVGAGLGWADWRLVAMPVSLPLSTATVHDVTTNAMTIAPAPAQSATLDFANYMVIAERPLFLPGRRIGGVATVEASPSPVPVAPQWRLSGIMLKGNVARALLKGDDSQPATWVRQDEEISGWRVIRIDARGVLLRSAAAEQLVELYPAGPADASAAE